MTLLFPNLPHLSLSYLCGGLRLSSRSSAQMSLSLWPLPGGKAGLAWPWLAGWCWGWLHSPGSVSKLLCSPGQLLLCHRLMPQDVTSAPFHRLVCVWAHAQQDLEKPQRADAKAQWPSWPIVIWEIQSTVWALKCSQERESALDTSLLCGDTEENLSWYNWHFEKGFFERVKDPSSAFCSVLACLVLSWPLGA